MESIIEAIRDEVLDLDPCVQRENLISYCDNLYRQWEEIQLIGEEFETFRKEYEIIKRLLSERLSHEEKLYIRLKYRIDMWEI